MINEIEMGGILSRVQASIPPLLLKPCYSKEELKEQNELRRGWIEEVGRATLLALFGSELLRENPFLCLEVRHGASNRTAGPKTEATRYAAPRTRASS